MRVLWLIATLCAGYGGIEFVYSIGQQNGSPQQAALAAYCSAYAIIPYCFVRCIEAIMRPDTTLKDVQQAILASRVAETPETTNTGADGQTA